MSTRRLSAAWSRLSSLKNAPVARSSHGLSAINGKAYLFGGEAKARHAIDASVHCLDYKQGEWKSMVAAGDSPTPRVGHAQCSARDHMFVFGGRTDVDMGEGNLNDLWAFNPAKSDWTKFESTNGTTPPEARSFHRAAATNDKVYIFGGCGSDGRLADLHEYDLNALKWRQLPSPPEHVAGRGGATFEASSDGRSLLMVAGFAGHETNDILKFDLATEEWEVIPSGWLRPRSVCASMSFQHPSGPCVLIFGGEVEPSNQGHEGAGGFASDLISVDPTNGTPMHLTIEPPPKSLRKEGSSFLPSAAAAEDAGDGEDPPEASSSSRGKGDASFLPSASAADEFGTSPMARGWGAATAISPTEGIMFGGLTGDDKAPVRLDDCWLLRVAEPMAYSRMV